MTDEDAPLEADIDLNYLEHLRQHAQQTSLHLQGRDPLSPLPSLYTESPASYWTSAEKSAFFHALSIHSRLRPDLIAECVQTKNVVDICAYMDMLEDGVRRDGSVVNRSKMEAAMEVSEKWIELEEERAAAIVGFEKKWEEEAAKLARAKELKLMKAEAMPRAKPGKAKSSDQLKCERAALKTLRKERRLKWKQEDVMRSLGTAHFKVIDNILRGEEETQAAAAHSRQSTMEPLPVNANEEMIDPVLRSNPIPTPGPSTSTPSVGPESSSIPENLSPASRRRLKKRLYMRRKRAEAAGRTDLLPVELSAERAKPGRKSKPRKKGKTEEGSMVPDEENKGQEQVDESDDGRHPHIGGKTRHYKIKSLLESMGMGAGALHQNGLGLFHLASLSKLMRMYNLLHGVPPDVSTEISADALQFLHVHVVQYVTELVHRTIVSREQERDMKAHTKVWRFNPEQIIPATVGHAIEMMDTASIGTKESILAGVFERLGVPPGSVDSSEDEEQEDALSGCPANDDALGDGPQLETTKPTFSLHQGMYTPLVRLTPYIHYGTSASTSDPLLPVDKDEEALATELRQEEELDEQDRLKAEQNENVLWDEYSHRATRTEMAENVGGGHQLRFKPPNGHIKSQVFVVDSDLE